MHTKPHPPRIARDPVSPSGNALRWCTQAERQEWIRQLVPDVPDLDVNTLLARPEWFKGYVIDPLDGFTPGVGGVLNFRLYYRDRQGHLWCVVERCTDYATAVEMGFIIAWATRNKG